MLKTIIIGAGRIFSKHFEALKNLELNYDVMAIVENDCSQHETIKKKTELPVYTSLEECLSDYEVDLAIVLTQSGGHYAIAKKLCGRVPHVIVEKPMTLNLNAALELVRLFDASNSSLYVVKQNRYNKPVQFLKSLLDRGVLGEKHISSVRVRWCREQKYYDQHDWRGTWFQDGGVISNQASHHLDLLQWMMGDFARVMAHSNTFGSDIEVEDSLVGIVEFKSGAMATIEATTAARPRDIEGSISILGSEGSVQIGGFAVNKLDYCNLKRDDISIPSLEENPDNVYGFGHQKYYVDFFECFKRNQKFSIDGSEAIKSIKLINALYKSIELGRFVTFDEDCSSNRLGRSEDFIQ